MVQPSVTTVLIVAATASLLAAVLIVLDHGLTPSTGLYPQWLRSQLLIVCGLTIAGGLLWTIIHMFLLMVAVHGLLLVLASTMLPGRTQANDTKLYNHCARVLLYCAFTQWLVLFAAIMTMVAIY